MATPTTSLTSLGSLAEGAGLLGKSMYEIQLSWDGPEELKACQLFLFDHYPKG